MKKLGKFLDAKKEFQKLRPFFFQANTLIHADHRKMTFYIEATNYRCYGELPKYWKEASLPLRRYTETISRFLDDNHYDDAAEFVDNHMQGGYWFNTWNELMSSRDIHNDMQKADVYCIGLHIIKYMQSRDFASYAFRVEGKDHLLLEKIDKGEKHDEMLLQYVKNIRVFLEFVDAHLV